MDQIQLLLESTGLSPDELIKKLAEYKAAEKKPAVTKPAVKVEIKEEPSSPEVILIEEDDDCDIGSTNIKTTIQSDINTSENLNIVCKDEVIDLSDEEDEEYKYEVNDEQAREIEEIINSNYEDSGDEWEQPKEAVSPVDEEFEIEEQLEHDENVNYLKGEVIEGKKENRLKITSLLAKRLNEEGKAHETIAQDCNERVEEEQSDVDRFVNRRPMLGSIRKSEGHGRKIARATKPPWMETYDHFESEIEDSPPTPIKVVDTDSMREQIFNQLSMLRGKKVAEEPLVHIDNPLVDIVTNKKLFAKRQPRSEKNEEKEVCSLGIKIVEVRGGFNNDFYCKPSSSKGMVVDFKAGSSSCVVIEEIKNVDTKPMNDVKMQFEIINKELDSEVIKVTKTSDFKKIKGWKSKKLLVPKCTTSEVETRLEEPKVLNNIVINPNEPSCSYEIPVEHKKEVSANDSKTSHHEEDIKTIDKKEAIPPAINVFASNNLDGFLDEQKTTYESNVDLLDSTVIAKKTPPPQESRFNESKRLYTLAENEDSNCINQNSKSNPYKPRTLAEKRKLLMNELNENETKQPAVKKKKEQDALIKRIRSTLPPDFVYSTISFRGKKLSIPSRIQKVTSIGYNMKRHKSKFKDFKIERDIKPSIYGNVKQEGVKYKPGPLSKKMELQSCSDKWATVLKKLPQAYLKVKPEFGKKIHPCVAPHVRFETYEITPERLEFALSALVNNVNTEKFKFNIPYAHNQENILLLKDIAKNEAIDIKPDVIKLETPDEVNSVIEKVVDDIVTYVELKDIEDTIIKDDEYCPEINEQIYTTVEKNKKRGRKAEIIKGKTKRTNLELKRLNVKVIEVNIEEENQEVECIKPYCKLGCVCNSLKNAPLPNDHCRKLRCQFSCSCSYDKLKKDTLKFLLPAGTDLLSERTVSRLQDAAKKDLAKVEKEFTQTVIHANNQTIVVGESTDRKRRPLKLPNKYRDYIESNVYSDEEKPDLSDEELVIKTMVLDSPRKPCSVQKRIEKTCRVLLRRLDLSHIIPLCLTHSQYNCPCNYQDLAVPKIQLKPLTKLYEPEEETIDTPPPKKVYRKTRYPVGEVKKSARDIKKPARYEKNLDQCARTKGIVTDYYHQRNKTFTYKRKLAKRFKHTELGEVGEFILSHWLTYKGEDLPINNAKCLENAEVDPFLMPMSVGPVDDIKKSRRKQKLLTREEPDLSVEPALQRRKKPTKKEKKISPKQTVNNNLTLNSDTFLPGVVENQHFAKLMGQSNNKDMQFRLLPWTTLITKYDEKVIFIWVYQDKNKFKYILTNSDETPAPGYENIYKFEEVEVSTIQPDFVRWVMQRQVPDNKKEGGRVFVILKISKSSWEICGICSRNGKNAQSETATGDSTENKIEVNAETKIDTNGDQNDKIVDNQLINNNETILITDNSLQTAEKKKKYEVSFTNTSFTKKSLAPFDGSRSKSAPAKHIIEASLPDTIDDTAKWRVIKLTTEFSVLSLTRNDFKIKCSDILSVLKVAARYQKTIIINNDQVSRNYSHKLFGLYMSPNFSDHIFIGPYFYYEKHDIETLQYVNNVLVNSKCFDKLKDAEIAGRWYYQIFPQKTPEVIAPQVVIDLTEIEENISETTDSAVVTKLPPKPSPRSILKKNVFNGETGVSVDVIRKDNSAVIILEQKECPTMERLFASRLRILIRNHHLPLPADCVPICFKVNFDEGLIYGYQTQEERLVGVYWPGDQGASGRLFGSTEMAKEWLQKELNTFFILVPSYFRITVSLVTPHEYRKALTRPTISPNYFKEVYVVGQFGALKLQDLAKDLTRFHEGFEEFDEKKLSNSNGNLKEFYAAGDVEFIKFIEKIRAHIQMEDKKSHNLTEAKILLENKKYALLTKHSKLIKQVEPATKEAIMQEFMKMWTPAPKPPRTPVKSVPAGNSLQTSDEIICLDSDDEDSPDINRGVNSNDRVNLDSNSTQSSNTTIQKGLLLKDKKISASLNKFIDMKIKHASLKRKSSTDIARDMVKKVHLKEFDFPVTKAEIIPVPIAPAPSYTKPGQSILKQSVVEVKPLPKKGNKSLLISKKNGVKLRPLYEKIDISHISTDKVSSFLGTSIKHCVSLSENQLNRLKALSETKPKV